MRPDYINDGYKSAHQISADRIKISADRNQLAMDRNHQSTDLRSRIPGIVINI